MKKNRLFFVLAAILFSAAIITSCQKEEVTNDELTLKKGKPAQVVQAVAVPEATYPVDGCGSVCIEPGSGDTYFKSGSVDGAIGSNSKTIVYKVYNTETDFVVELSYSRTPANSGAGSTLKVTVGEEHESKTIINGNSATYTFPLADNWKGCDEVLWSLEETAGDGALLSFSGDYGLIGICGGVCAESFSYKANGNDTYTFTYVSAKKINNALLELTFPQGVVISAPEGWKMPGQSQTSVVRQINKNFEECEVFTFTFGLVHSTNGNGPLWTDFKVNDVKKN